MVGLPGRVEARLTKREGRAERVQQHLLVGTADQVDEPCRAARFALALARDAALALDL